MKTLIKSALLLLLVMSLTGCGDDVSSISSDDLVKRNGLYYKKFSDVPFSGRVIDTHYGLITNGKREGEWTHYTSDGQLLSTGNYKNGKEEGEWDYYHGIGPLSTENAQLSSTGNYKNGKKEGEWIRYHDNGQLYSKGNYKNGKTEGEWVGYWDNGQLQYKGNHKNGKREGEWVYYHTDGNLIKEWSGTFKNGVKISD